MPAFENCRRCRLQQRLVKSWLTSDGALIHSYDWPLHGAFDLFQALIGEARGAAGAPLSAWPVKLLVQNFPQSKLLGFPFGDSTTVSSFWWLQRAGASTLQVIIMFRCWRAAALPMIEVQHRCWFNDICHHPGLGDSHNSASPAADTHKLGYSRYSFLSCDIEHARRRLGTRVIRFYSPGTVGGRIVRLGRAGGTVRAPWEAAGQTPPFFVDWGTQTGMTA